MFFKNILNSQLTMLYCIVQMICMHQNITNSSTLQTQGVFLSSCIEGMTRACGVTVDPVLIDSQRER